LLLFKCNLYRYTEAEEARRLAELFKREDPVGLCRLNQVDT
jgi:hypothetical protein